MLIKIYPENPNGRAVRQVADILNAGGLIVCPTDGVYAFACSLASPKAVQRLAALRGKDVGGLTLMCADLSQISDYARVDNGTFKILKRNLPGHFTFILPASSRIPDKLLERRKNIGIRIPVNPIPHALISETGFPLVTCSVKQGGDDQEFITDPELINEKWDSQVDAVIDAGLGTTQPTTIVDLTAEDPRVIRDSGVELIL